MRTHSQWSRAAELRLTLSLPHLSKSATTIQHNMEPVCNKGMLRTTGILTYLRTYLLTRILNSSTCTIIYVNIRLYIAETTSHFVSGNDKISKLANQSHLQIDGCGWFRRLQYKSISVAWSTTKMRIIRMIKAWHFWSWPLILRHQTK